MGEIRRIVILAALLAASAATAADRPAPPASDVAPAGALPSQVLRPAGAQSLLIGDTERRALGLRSGPDSIADAWRTPDGRTILVFSGSLLKGGRGTFGVAVDATLTHLAGAALAVLLEPVRGGDDEDADAAPDPKFAQAHRSTFDLDYAGGGTIFECPGGKGRTYYFYHGENHTDPDGRVQRGPKAGWTGVGMAEWNGQTRRFERDGQVVGLSNGNGWKQQGGEWLTQQSPPASGNPSVVANPQDGYAYLYFTDLTDEPAYSGIDLNCGTRVCTAVARTRVDELCSAPAGHPAPWRKYHHGTFAEPAVFDASPSADSPAGTGGRFTPLYPRDDRAAENVPNVTYLPARRQYVMVALSNPGRRIVARYSGDGLAWSSPAELVGSSADEDRVLAYPRLHVLGAGENETYVLTYTRKSAERWTFAELVRLPLGFGGMPPPSVPSPVR